MGTQRFHQNGVIGVRDKTGPSPLIYLSGSIFHVNGIGPLQRVRSRPPTLPISLYRRVMMLLHRAYRGFLEKWLLPS